MGLHDFKHYQLIEQSQSKTVDVNAHKDDCYSGTSK